MPANISAHQENHYLPIKASGIIESLEELKDFSTALYAEGIKYDTRNVVIDEMQLQLTTSVVHQCELINFYSESLPPQIKQYKIAVAVDPKYRELAEFWELYGSNRGYPWKGFTSLENALDWIEQVKD